jgi:hypothetical protein
MHAFGVRAEKWLFLPLNQIPENRGYEVQVLSHVAGFLECAISLAL